MMSMANTSKDAARRRLIARGSPLQREAGPPSCEDCGKPLTSRDLRSYWDGCPDLTRARSTPRCCEDCAEGDGR